MKRAWLRLAPLAALLVAGCGGGGAVGEDAAALTDLAMPLDLAFVRPPDLVLHELQWKALGSGAMDTLHGVSGGENSLYLIGEGAAGGVIFQRDRKSTRLNSSHG